MKKGLYLFTILSILWACKSEDPYATINQPEDQMHLQVSPSPVVLNPQLRDEVAATFTWTWPELQYGAESYVCAFKMDIADNQFKTAIPKMTIANDNQLTFTHKELNDLLADWGIVAGQSAQLEAELIAEFKGTDVYVKPMISKLIFTITGYANHLYVMGSATLAGTDFASAFEMDKIAGTDAYNWRGLLSEGSIQFVSAQNASAIIYASFPISRSGFYDVTYDMTDNTMTTKEPLYLVGDATPGGWALHDATALDFETTPATWTGFLSTGEVKFACNPQSGLFEDPFYQSASPDAAPEGTQQIVFNPDGKGADNKWRITEEGVYSISVDVTNRTVSFARDHSMDDLPVKEVWICGSATPRGWDTPFPEKMMYDFQAPKGTFVWNGNLTEGEIKFPLNNSQYEGAFYLADEYDMHITENTSYHINYFASCVDVPDKKWILDDPGDYKIVLNVINNTVKFYKQ